MNDKTKCKLSVTGTFTVYLSPDDGEVFENFFNDVFNTNSHLCKNQRSKSSSNSRPSSKTKLTLECRDRTPCSSRMQLYDDNEIILRENSQHQAAMSKNTTDGQSKEVFPITEPNKARRLKGNKSKQRIRSNSTADSGYSNSNFRRTCADPSVQSKTFNFDKFSKLGDSKTGDTNAARRSYVSQASEIGEMDEFEYNPSSPNDDHISRADGGQSGTNSRH